MLNVVGRVVESVLKDDVVMVIVKEVGRCFDGVVDCCEGRPVGCGLGATLVVATYEDAAKFEFLAGMPHVEGREDGGR